MRVLIDTNVLISALINPNSKPAKVIEQVSRHHILVLSTQNVKEFFDIVDRKLPDRSPAATRLLAEIDYELIKITNRSSVIKIRDTNDQPIIDTAIANHVNVLVTGDKDFLSLNTDLIEILSPVDYLTKYF